MATTTVKISISSADLTSDTLSISKTLTLQSAAGAGITQTSGLNRVNGVNGDTTIFAAADFTVDEAYLFLHNTDSTRGNQVTIKHGSQTVGVLQGGDSVFMAIAPQSSNIIINADSASTTVEYQLFHNG